jgi:hypothetical protein
MSCIASSKEVTMFPSARVLQQKQLLLELKWVCIEDISLRFNWVVSANLAEENKEFLRSSPWRLATPLVIAVSSQAEVPPLLGSHATQMFSSAGYTPSAASGHVIERFQKDRIRSPMIPVHYTLRGTVRVRTTGSN